MSTKEPKKTQGASEFSEPVGDPCAEQFSEIQAQRRRIDELEAALAAALIRNTDLETKARTGRAGYLVTTPNPQYNAKTMRVQFRNGRAFIPASPEGEQLAWALRAEFGYTVQYLEDWQEAPEAEHIGKSLIDSLVITERR